jgi:hypothetical protein
MSTMSAENSHRLETNCRDTVLRASPPAISVRALVSVRPARVHVTADMSLFEFEAHISGFYRSLRKRLLGVDELEGVVGA